MNSIKKIAAGVAALALAAGACANDMNTTVEETFSSAASGFLTFDLFSTGLNGLDGLGTHEDVFSVTINGVPTYQGTFALGGFGTSSDLLADDDTGFAATIAGNKVSFVIPVFAEDGLYTIDFNYSSLQGTHGKKPNTITYAGKEAGESWSLSNVAVVPEPTSVALMLAGLGMIGGLARRCRQG